MLYSAALLIFLLGLAHSVLGERFILMRLFRRPDLPKLFGGTEFTTRTLRFAWHLTTIAWWGLGAILVLAAQEQLTAANTLRTIAAVAIVSACLPLLITRARHLSWIVLLLIAVLVLRSGAA